MVIVFIAGPLSGLIAQPLVGAAGSHFVRSPSYSHGVLAGNSKSRLGGWYPFMIGGAIVTAATTTPFGFTRPVVGMFSEEGSRLLRAQTTHSVADSVPIAHQYGAPAIWLAIVAIYITDFSINAGMCRPDSRYVPLTEFSPRHNSSRWLCLGRRRCTRWSATCRERVGSHHAWRCFFVFVPINITFVSPTEH